MTQYIGHDQPWREWRAALGGERMHHAWLLAGRRGVGKGPLPTPRRPARSQAWCIRSPPIAARHSRQG